jgi:Transposase DDE domain group 1
VAPRRALHACPLYRETNLARPAERVVAFYNQRGTAEQWIKKGKGAIKWTRLSCRTFSANAVRLQHHVLLYNLSNFMRALAMPKAAKPWSLTSLREKPIKIGAKVISHGRYATFQDGRGRGASTNVRRNHVADRSGAPPAPAWSASRTTRDASGNGGGALMPANELHLAFGCRQPPVRSPFGSRNKENFHCPGASIARSSLRGGRKPVNVG